MNEKHSPLGEADELQRYRLQQVVAKLHQWMEEDSNDDEAAWDVLEKELARDPIRMNDVDELGS